MSAAIIWVVLNVLSCFQTIIWYFQLIVSLWLSYTSDIQLQIVTS